MKGSTKSSLYVGQESIILTKIGCIKIFFSLLISSIKSFRQALFSCSFEAYTELMCSDSRKRCSKMLMLVLPSSLPSNASTNFFVWGWGFRSQIFEDLKFQVRLNIGRSSVPHQPLLAVSSVIIIEILVSFSHYFESLRAWKILIDVLKINHDQVLIIIIQVLVRVLSILKR